MSLPFNEAKAAEAAAFLLSRSGGRMNYNKLIKLLYIIDRTALLEWGNPITTDYYLLKATGPVLGQIHDLITEGSPTPSAWSEYISEPQNGYEVELQRGAPYSELSAAERGLIDRILGEYGSNTVSGLNDVTRRFPEWKDPKGTVVLLEYRDILRAGGKTESETKAIVEEIESFAAVIEELEPWAQAIDVNQNA